VIQYYENTFFDLQESGELPIWEIERFVWIETADSDEERFELLAALLTHDAAKVRRDAVEALGQVESEKATDRLLAVLREEADEEVRRAAAGGLGRRFETRVTAALLRTAREDPSRRVRFSSLTLLHHHDVRAFTPELLELYRTNESTGFRAQILYALRKTEDPELLQHLRGFLAEGGDPELQRHLLDAVSEVGTREAADLVASVLQRTSNPRIQTAAFQALGKLGFGESFEKLHPYTRLSCEERRPGFFSPLLEAVRQVGTRDQILPVYEHFLSCSDRGIRSKVVSHLAMDGSDESASLLERHLREEPDPALARQISDALTDPEGIVPDRGGTRPSGV
jgi:HEAT repeat protein